MPVRKTVHVVSDKDHRNPIPTCVTLGNLILPSVISGISGLPDGVTLTPEEEIERGFQRMKEIVEAAGGSVDSIGKITVYLKNFADREFVNKSWLKMFPDENNRPARHVIPLPLPGRVVMQLDVIASIV
jgi:2-iminobutanoate/2-iminopropanoate deaminase